MIPGLAVYHDRVIGGSEFSSWQHRTAIEIPEEPAHVEDAQLRRVARAHACLMQRGEDGVSLALVEGWDPLIRHAVPAIDALRSTHVPLSDTTPNRSPVPSSSTMNCAHESMWS